MRLIASRCHGDRNHRGFRGVGHRPQQAPAVQSKTEPGAHFRPTMRHDLRNTGASDPPGLTSDAAVGLQTGKGIFATLTIAVDGTIYAGSADNVPSTASRGPPEVALRDRRDHRHRTRTTRRRVTDQWLRRRSRKVSAPTVPSPATSGSSVLHADAAAGRGQRLGGRSPNVGPDGVIYQGNTGGAYAVNPDGSQKWAHQAENAVWTVPAMDDSGSILGFGWTPDLRPQSRRIPEVARTTLHTPHRRLRWTPRARCTPVRSTARSTRWTPRPGDVSGNFKTGDHIYSPA